MEIRIKNGKILVGDLDKMRDATQEELAEIVSLGASKLEPLVFTAALRDGLVTLVDQAGRLILSGQGSEGIDVIEAYLEGIQSLGYIVKLELDTVLDQ